MLSTQEKLPLRFAALAGLAAIALITVLPRVSYAQGRADSVAVDSVVSAPSNGPVVIVNGKQVPIVSGKTQTFRLGSGQSVQVQVTTTSDSGLSGAASAAALQSLKAVVAQMDKMPLGPGASRMDVGLGGQLQIFLGDGKGSKVLPPPQIKLDAPPAIELDSTATPGGSVAPPSK